MIKKMKKNPLTFVPFRKLKSTKAWKLTSELVRKKSGGRCYTCNAAIPFNKLVAGHFIEKLGNAATYFDLDNLRAQCSWNCNKMRHGAKDVYAFKLIKELGPDIIEKLHRRAGRPRIWTEYELQKIVEERDRELKQGGGE